MSSNVITEKDQTCLFIFQPTCQWLTPIGGEGREAYCIANWPHLWVFFTFYYKRIWSEWCRVKRTSTAANSERQSGWRVHAKKKYSVRDTSSGAFLQCTSVQLLKLLLTTPVRSDNNNSNNNNNNVIGEHSPCMPLPVLSLEVKGHNVVTSTFHHSTHIPSSDWFLVSFSVFVGQMLLKTTVLCRHGWFMAVG